MERRPRAKVRPFFSLTGIWVMPLSWYSTGIFDGDDLVFVVLDFAEGGVEGGGFAGAGGAGDQHHAVGFVDVAAELDEVGFAEKPTTSSESLANFSLIDSLSSTRSTASSPWMVGMMETRKSIRRRFVADAETAVLRDAALGDIEFAHDLDARNDGGVPVLRDGRHGVVEHAVDAVLDGDFLVARFDVDIAGAAFEGVEDGGVDQLDDRRDVAVAGGELVDGEGFVGVLFVADDVEREAFGDFFEDALGLFGLLEQVGDLGGGGDFDAELLVEQEAEFVDGVEVAGVGEGDFEGSVDGRAGARSCSGT